MLSRETGMELLAPRDILRNSDHYRKRGIESKYQGSCKDKNHWIGASLVAQRLRIRLPMQGTWVRALVREDPTCHGATKPVRHNY